MDTNFTRNEVQAIIAEGVAVLFFVFLGAGSVVAAAATGFDAAIVAISLAHGLGILLAVAWTANISGGHINPAVTVAMIISGNIRIPLGIAYIGSQLVGAVAGALLLKWAAPNSIEAAANLGAHQISDGVAVGEGLLLEIIGTFFLLLIIYGVAISKKGWSLNAPIAIGLAVGAIHFALVPLTGASVNPARSFGPALVANEWGDFWVYVVGPVVGAGLMAVGWVFWRDLGDEPLDDTQSPFITPNPAGTKPAPSTGD